MYNIYIYIYIYIYMYIYSVYIDVYLCTYHCYFHICLSAVELQNTVPTPCQISLSL